MNLHQIKTRRLEIAVEMGKLQERDVALRRQMIDVECQSTCLARELAELDLEEANIGSCPPPRQVKPNGD